MLYCSPMKIGELSKASGVSIDTIRYYEKRGLMPVAARSPAGYRAYHEQDISRLNFIVQAKSLGFTLEEIKQLLDLRADGKACVEVREVAESKAEDIAVRIEKLTHMRETLLSLAKACAQSSKEDDCPILKSLER